jgi:hypothetical protein
VVSPLEGMSHGLTLKVRVCMAEFEWHLGKTVTAALTATPSSDLNTQVESCRDEQEVVV